MKHILTSTIALLLTATGLHAGTQTYEKRIQEPVTEVSGGPYWAVFGGVNAEQSGDLNSTRNRLGRFSNEYQSETGWFGGLKLGYEYPTSGGVQFAAEVEALYSRLDAEARSTSGGFTLRTSGEISAAALLVNGLIKFKPLGPVRPYIGAGAGVAHLWLKNTDSTVSIGGTRIGSLPRGDAEDWTFAYQGIAGLDWQVNERWSIFTEYKALVFHDAIGIENYLNHLVGVGVRVKF